MAFARTMRFVAFCLPVVLLGSESGATANCRALESELNRLPVVIGTSATLRSFTIAIQRQEAAIADARQDLRDHGCSTGSVTVIGGTHAKECKQREDRLSGMIENLARLENRKANIGVVDTGGERGRLLAALASQGCRPGELIVNEPDAPVVSDIPGATYLPTNTEPQMSEFSPSGADESAPAPQMPDVTDLPRGKGYKTICVRSCDGTFFPISTMTDPARFGRDASACAARCPAAETELFYGPSTSLDFGKFLSTRTGTAYGETPNAFAFQSRAGNASAPGCTCRPAVLGLAEPMHRRANADEELEPRERPFTEEDANVRKVGPDFLPLNSGIDLKRPRSGLLPSTLQ